MKTVIRQLYKNIPNNVWELCKKHEVILAGGAIERIVNGGTVNDYDMYFRSRSLAYAFLSELSKCNFVCICKSPRSLVYQNNDKFIINAITFKTFPTPEDVIAHFDFECCKASYDFKYDKLTVSPLFWSSMQMKQLIYTGSLFPVGALIRMQKYIGRGYTPDYISILKLFRDLNNLDVIQNDILEEQIGGMYGLNFEIKGLTLDQIIEKLDSELIIKKVGGIVDLNLNEYFHDVVNVF